MHSKTYNVVQYIYNLVKHGPRHMLKTYIQYIWGYIYWTTSLYILDIYLGLNLYVLECFVNICIGYMYWSAFICIGPQCLESWSGDVIGRELVVGEEVVTMGGKREGGRMIVVVNKSLCWGLV